jgi:hypothetical protein
MQLKNFHSPLDIGTWPAPLTLKEHKHPPVADLSTPQASNRRVTMKLWATATEPPLVELLNEVLAEGKNEISVELCVFGTG